MTTKSYIEKFEYFPKQASYNMGILEYDTQCESSHNQNLLVHHTYWFSSSSQEWIVDFGHTKHMIRHEKSKHPLSNYRREHIGEKVIIDYNSNLKVSRCNDFTIDSTKFGYFLSCSKSWTKSYFYYTTRTKQWNANQWVVEDMNDGF